MTIVNPLAASNVVVHATATTPRSEERQHDLRTEQIVRATVVEGGLDRTMLELKNHRYWIETDQELKPGQQLELQVLTTHPKLTFKLLTSTLDVRMSALIPLLTKRFDWDGLLQQVQQQSGKQSEPLKQILSQLSAFLRPQNNLSEKELSAMGAALERLKAATALLPSPLEMPLQQSIDKVLTTLKWQHETLDLPEQLKLIALQIRQQPELLRAYTGTTQEKFFWLLTRLDQTQTPLDTEQARLLAAELKTFLQVNPTIMKLELSPALRRNLQILTGAIPKPQLTSRAPDLPQQLHVIARQIRQQPEVMRGFMPADQTRITQLLSQIDQPQKPLQASQARQLASELKVLLLTKGVPLPQLLGRSTQALQPLLNPAAPQTLETSAELVGQLKELAGQLGIALATKPDWPQDLKLLAHQLSSTLQPLAADPEILIRGENLGILSQLLGLNLEAELLRGRTKDALASLKLALLGERTELGPKGEEALSRIELFQICRVRLAEQGVTFLPLPLPFLEEGFLLIDQDEEHQQTDKKEHSTHLTLHLRMSSLGNLRVDMLSEPTGILLRIACEDQQRLEFLQSLSAKLEARLQKLNFRSVSFTTGVEAPARELLKKILPAAQGMLDARI